MVFKLAVGLLSLSIAVSAANFKRVACPDGTHTATNAACCVFFALADTLVNDKFDGTCGEDGKIAPSYLGLSTMSTHCSTIQQPTKQFV